MNSYEVVRRAIEFDEPGRLPLSLDDPDLSDVHFVSWNEIVPWDVHGPGSLEDHWGCIWVRSKQDNMGQVKGHPLADWNALDHFCWPDPNDPAFYEGMDARLTSTKGKYVRTGIFMLLFERMHSLRGFENTLTDLYFERERIEILADRIVEFDLCVIENISQRFPSQIHGLGFSVDWGTQQNLMIKPELWEEFFKPRYKRIFAAIHQAGWHVWMHSCGKINAIMESLIEIGVNVLNLQQPRALGIEEIGQQFRGRICFETACDIQHTLPFKGADEIQEEARLLLEHWAAPNGGFILSIDNDAALNFSPENMEAMWDAFLMSDPWRQE